MGDNSRIEWTDATWNPIRARLHGSLGWHCEHASDGCRNCYAETMNARRGTGLAFTRPSREQVEIFLDETTLLAPTRWQRPRRIFVCSMTDLFAGFVDEPWIRRIFSVIQLAERHTFQILTKRPHLMRTRWHEMMVQPYDVPSNTWLGVSVEQRRHLDRVDVLRETKAAVRFLSLEPLLEDLGTIDLTGIHQVIVGGESGPRARPMHPDWARSVRDQCTGAGVPFFFKQWGAWMPGVEAHAAGIVPAAQRHPWGLCQPAMARLGKAKPPPLLDGARLQAFPGEVVAHGMD